MVVEHVALLLMIILLRYIRMKLAICNLYTTGKNYHETLCYGRPFYLFSM